MSFSFDWDLSTYKMKTIPKNSISFKPENDSKTRHESKNLAIFAIL